jgi:hypothetical protein
MKIFLFLAMLFTLTVSADSCKKKKDPALFRGRLEVKGNCMNYTLKLTEGKIDTSIVAAKWTDEITGKAYTNVFALGNPCDFPKTIKQGDEFYFRIDTATSKKECVVCMAYYPVPPRKLSIQIADKP